ncbi:MAG: oxidoreductase [Bacteroidetes bacterium]|nr:MAG: oxidoreductase [Bacteroidota bacterium]
MKMRLSFFFVMIVLTLSSTAQILKVAVAGLNHDHAYGIMNQFKNGQVIIIGIAEPDKNLADKYKKRFQLPDSIFFSSLDELLKHKKPDAVLAYNAIVDHLSVVEACAPKGISVMVEKPLSTTVEDADKMAALAKKYNIKLLTNYETTWYPTNHQVYSIVNSQNSIGSIRKMVVHSGHQGPKEIGCSPEFLSWLTDPVKNGGGAIIDFGCYGANLMTWLMRGQVPIAVTAVTKRIKPDIYPKVDDDATILLEYPDATGIIEASWNWPYGIKDLEVFSQSAYLHALNANVLEEKQKDSLYKVNVNPAPYRDNLIYLAAALKGEINETNDLSSLENNLIVVRILDAARRSAREGKRIELKK